MSAEKNHTQSRIAIAGTSARGVAQLKVQEQSTVIPIREFQYGQTVDAAMFVSKISSLAVGSATTSQITTVSHGAFKGDVVRFTSGTNNTREVSVVKIISANVFQLGEVLATAPSAADTYDLLRFQHPQLTAGGSIPIAQVSGTVKETRFHDTAVTTINSSGGAFVEVGTGSYATTAYTNVISLIKILSTIGEPLVFRKAANSGAAATAADLFVANQGEGPSDFGISISIGDRLWVRSLSGNSISSGYLTLNFEA